MIAENIVQPSKSPGQHARNTEKNHTTAPFGYHIECLVSQSFDTMQFPVEKRHNCALKCQIILQRRKKTIYPLQSAWFSVVSLLISIRSSFTLKLKKILKDVHEKKIEIHWDDQKS